MKITSASNNIFSSETWIKPDSSVVEQASDILAAEYVASLISEGETVVDLTAGLGVDAYYFAKRAKFVYALELDPNRAETLVKNFQNHHIDNIKVVNADCVDWLLDNNLFFDTAYIDPARRDASGHRFFMLSECNPNVLRIIPFLEKCAKRLLIKTSPLLDLSAIQMELPNVVGFQIIEVDREVKEVLIDINFNKNSSDFFQPYIKCVRLFRDKAPDVISLSFNDSPIECLSSPTCLRSGGYIYEPSPSIMKAGKFGSLISTYPDLKKLDKNTNLFYSESLYETFPGRIFHLIDFISSKDLKKMKGERFNVISRNHPAKASELESYFKLLPSDSMFLIATKCSGKKLIIKCSKVV